jgi:transposase InsO family protein
MPPPVSDPGSAPDPLPGEFYLSTSGECSFGLYSLTLQAHTARRPGRTHDGAVVALRSNVRWCSDYCEIAGRDGSIVRLLFAIDACDREILGWHATTAG